MIDRRTVDSSPRHALQLAWDRVKALDIELPAELDREVASPDKVKEQREDARQTQRIDDGALAQTKVIELGGEYWKDVARRASEHGELTEKLAGILKVACNPRPGRIPTETQSKLLLELDRKLRD